MTCIHCRKPCDSYFEVIRKRVGRAPSPPIVACSALCLASWAQNYIVTGGKMVAAQASNVISGLIEAIRGPR